LDIAYRYRVVLETSCEGRRDSFLVLLFNDARGRCENAECNLALASIRGEAELE